MEKQDLEKEIEYYLKELIENIFKNQNIERLQDLEKRYLIFTYLCEHLEYDHSALEDKIQKKISIHPTKSLINTLKNQKGVCNSFVMVYKFLLEKVGIPSIACICNYHIFEKQHKTILVKNKDTYSFDDITMVVLGEENFETAFGYNLEDALYLKTPQENMFGNPSILYDSFYKEVTSIFEDEKIIQKKIQMPTGYTDVDVIAFPEIKEITFEEKEVLRNNYNVHHKK